MNTHLSNKRERDLLWSPKVLREKLYDENVSIIDTRRSEAFASGHVPNAKHFDLYFINCDDTREASLASFTRMWGNLLGWHGVQENNTILFYGDFTDMCAARGFWFLEYLGHQDTHVLDGGFKQWEEAGMPIETECVPVRPVKFNFKRKSSTIATFKTILKALNEKGNTLVDTRSYAEYIGTDIRAARGGAIPGAKHIDWINFYDSESGRMKTKSELRKIFSNAGVQSDDNITVYCNTGYRSAHAYLALRLLGYRNIKNYIGSWQEWGNRNDLPIITPHSS